jgi:hypothetical protein
MFRSFREGIGTWSRVFIESLTHGNFVNASSEYTSFMLISLFGNPGQTKEAEEIEKNGKLI